MNWDKNKCTPISTYFLLVTGKSKEANKRQNPNDGSLAMIFLPFDGG